MSYAKGIIATAPFMIHFSDGFVYGAGPLTCGVRAVYPKLLFIFHILPVSRQSPFKSLVI